MLTNALNSLVNLKEREPNNWWEDKIMSMQNIVDREIEEKKAMMVVNLLVVLCGNKDAQPIVNTGNIN